MGEISAVSERSDNYQCFSLRDHCFIYENDASYSKKFCVLHVVPFALTTKNTKSSGIQVKDECKQVFEELKIGHKYSYVIYKISGDFKFIEVDHLGELGESYDSFCSKLMEAGNNKEGRYAVMDCQYAKEKASKLVFMMWLPDDKLGIKQKMIYSSSKKAIRDKLQGIAKEMQCNDPDDLGWSNLVEKCQSKYD